ATPVQLLFKNIGASNATNVGLNGGVVITLAAGVSYVSMASGPLPTVTSGPGGTTVLTWGVLGDVPAGTTVLSINATAALGTIGVNQIASISAKYGDIYAENFADNGCSSVSVSAAAGAGI